MSYFFLISFAILSILSNANGFLDFYPKIRTFEVTGDVGDALYLTPLIEAGKIKEARSKSATNFTDFKDIPSYSGYFTVDKKYNSNLFFWYFPTQGLAKDPLILWLQGGPGMTSLFGVFYQHGPYVLESAEKLTLRDPTWIANHHMLYIDNPVGAGFSFTDDSRGYARDEKSLASNVYNALTQFFQVFPELQSNDFFVSGESYGGKYAPSIAYAIHRNNPKADIKINLKGFTAGDGLCDPVNQLGMGPYLYNIGLIDLNARKHINDLESQIASLINQEKYTQAMKICNDVIYRNDGKSLFTNLTGLNNYFNYLYVNDSDPGYLSLYVQTSNVRKALHVGNNTFNNGDTVKLFIVNDILQSVAPWVSNLLDHYRGLFYNGQLDIIIAYPLTLNYLQKLNFSGAAEYATAKRHIWRVENDVAGYWKTAGKLTEVLVRKAGHSVPIDQPNFAFDLITKFTRNTFVRN